MTSQTFLDPVLGLLQRTREGLWLAEPKGLGPGIEFTIAGPEEGPAAECIESAHQVVERFERFRGDSRQAVLQHATALQLVELAQSSGWELIGVECLASAGTFQFVWVEQQLDLSGWWEVRFGNHEVVEVQRLVL